MYVYVLISCPMSTNVCNEEACLTPMQRVQVSYHPSMTQSIADDWVTLAV